MREDAGLFPEPSARHPPARPTIAKPQRDHEMIAMPPGRSDRAITSDATPSEPVPRPDGLCAIMEPHSQDEERELLRVLAAPDLDVHQVSV